MSRWRRRTRRSPSPRGPAPGRVLGRRLARRTRRRPGRRVTGCCPSPAPAAHGRPQTWRPSGAADGRRVSSGGSGVDTRRSALGTRHRHSGRPARRVWSNHMSAVPAASNPVRPRGQRNPKRARASSAYASPSKLPKHPRSAANAKVRSPASPPPFAFKPGKHPEPKREAEPHQGGEIGPECILPWHIPVLHTEVLRWTGTLRL